MTPGNSQATSCLQTQLVQSDAQRELTHCEKWLPHAQQSLAKFFGADFLLSQFTFTALSGSHRNTGIYRWLGLQKKQGWAGGAKGFDPPRESDSELERSVRFRLQQLNAETVTSNVVSDDG